MAQRQIQTDESAHDRFLHGDPKFSLHVTKVVQGFEHATEPYTQELTLNGNGFGVTIVLDQQELGDQHTRPHLVSKFDGLRDLVTNAAADYGTTLPDMYFTQAAPCALLREYTLFAGSFKLFHMPSAEMQFVKKMLDYESDKETVRSAGIATVDGNGVAVVSELVALSARPQELWTELYAPGFDHLQNAISHTANFNTKYRWEFKTNAAKYLMRQDTSSGYYSTVNPPTPDYSLARITNMRLVTEEVFHEERVRAHLSNRKNREEGKKKNKKHMKGSMRDEPMVYVSDSFVENAVTSVLANTSNVTIDIDLSSPIREIILVGQIVDCLNDGNYDSTGDPTAEGSDLIGPFDFTGLEEKGSRFEGHLFETAELKIDNVTRFLDLSPQYYHEIVSRNRGVRVPDQKIYRFVFADSLPELHPNGFNNFASVGSAKLYLKFSKPLSKGMLIHTYARTHMISESLGNGQHAVWFS